MPGDAANVSQSVRALSTMITPVILILAGASLIAATTARLDRINEAMHELARAFELHVAAEHGHELLRDEQVMLWAQIERASRRARLLQATTAILHLALMMFVLTSIGLGIDVTTSVNLGLVPVMAGLVGAILLLASVIVLVYDSLIGMNATREEAQFTLRMTEHRASRSHHEVPRPRRRFVVPRP